jgi:hypothetical protein
MRDWVAEIQIAIGEALSTQCMYKSKERMGWSAEVVLKFFGIWVITIIVTSEPRTLTKLCGEISVSGEGSGAILTLTSYSICLLW